MPTATTTLTRDDVETLSTSVISLKPELHHGQAAESSTVATLRSLYPRAAKAFLQRDIVLTHSLLNSAFALIRPPLYAGEDDYAVYRRKWDILRITLETTVYASPPSSEDPQAFPAALRANRMLSPQSLVSSLLSRSLILFTPSNPPTKPSHFFLPQQILTTLILASIRLGCPEVGRGIVEDWLARRASDALATDDGRSGYIKIMELYCLHILPRMEDWEYAQDFLQYERELDESTRQTMITTIREMQTQALKVKEAKARAHATNVPSRSASPAHSESSRSSSSTHTATPRKPQPAVTSRSKGKAKDHSTDVSKKAPNGVAAPPQLSSTLSSSSTASIASVTTSRTITPSSINHSRPLSRRESSKELHHGRAAQNGHAIANGHDGSLAPIPRPPYSASLRESSTVRAPSTLTLIRSYLQTLFQNTSRSQFTAFLLLFVVFPVLSFLFRVRRRRLLTATRGAEGTADVVRRRLVASQGIGIGFVRRVWEEAVRAVGDTVRMGGRGLV